MAYDTCKRFVKKARVWSNALILFKLQGESSDNNIDYLIKEYWDNVSWVNAWFNASLYGSIYIDRYKASRLIYLAYCTLCLHHWYIIGLLSAF